MAAEYLDWLTEIFEEAQVPYNAQTADYLDRVLHEIAGVSYPQKSDDQVFRVLRERFLKIGPPGRQLLAGFIRDAAYARRDSALRPREGGAHFDNRQYKDERTAG
ncbi:MAG: hypothetical protein H6741_15785 [Alphaproteobacteria bacterium]|nr:hypothetical protein [Alphaproteobacteria bacterium]